MSTRVDHRATATPNQIEATKVYEDFVASFGGVNSSKSCSTFVRGGANDKYTLGRGKKAVPDVCQSEEDGKDTRKRRRRLRKEDESKKRKRRDIDSFMKEIRERQERGEPPSFEDTPGSFDDGDPNTTNLYVGNLAPSVTEEVLGDRFSEYGDILSVKIMWPRNDEQRARNRNCGFVSFRRRKDAEDAKFNMQHEVIQGNEIRLGWGKALSMLRGPVRWRKKITDVTSRSRPQSVEAKKKNGDLESQSSHTTMRALDRKITIRGPSDRVLRETIDLLAEYVAKDGQYFEKTIVQRERSNKAFSFLFDAESDASRYYRWRVWSLVNGDTRTQWRTEPFQMFVGGPFWIPPALNSIPVSASLSPKSDPSVLRRVEKRNGTRDRTFLTGRARERERERQKRRESSRLGRRESEELRNILDTVRELDRESVRKAMVFALDFADSAEEIVRKIRDSFVAMNTPAPLKVGRLYVVSDILHNASVATFRIYRSLFRACLPSIFWDMSRTLRSLSSRLAASSMEQRVMSVLLVWEEWGLFSPMFLKGLETTFLHDTSTDAGFESELSTIRETDLDVCEISRKCESVGLVTEGVSGMDMLRNLHRLSAYVSRTCSPVENEGTGNIELDGVSLGKRSIGNAEEDDVALITDEDDVDGVPLNGKEDVDGAVVDEKVDVDGVPLDEEEDVDGVPLDEEGGVGGVPLDEEEDVDGVPLDEEAGGMDGIPLGI